MINVKIDKGILHDMLVDRVKFWTMDSDEIELFSVYYLSEIELGHFNNKVLDIKYLVDTDCICNFKVITKDEFENYNIKSENDIKIYGYYNDKYLVKMR